MSLSGQRCRTIGAASAQLSPALAAQDHLVFTAAQSEVKPPPYRRNKKPRHFRSVAAMVGTPKMNRNIGNSSVRVYPAFATPTHRLAVEISNQSTTKIKVAA